jgi:hypothetical protein
MMYHRWGRLRRKRRSPSSALAAVRRRTAPACSVVNRESTGPDARTCGRAGTLPGR